MKTVRRDRAPREASSQERRSDKQRGRQEDGLPNMEIKTQTNHRAPTFTSFRRANVPTSTYSTIIMYFVRRSRC